MTENYTPDAAPAFAAGGTPRNAARVRLSAERDAPFAAVFGLDTATLAITAVALGGGGRGTGVTSLVP